MTYLRNLQLVCSISPRAESATNTEASCTNVNSSVIPVSLPLLSKHLQTSKITGCETHESTWQILPAYDVDQPSFPPARRWPVPCRSASAVVWWVAFRTEDALAAEGNLYGVRSMSRGLIRCRLDIGQQPRLSGMS